MSGGGTEDADLIDQNNVWYEAKAYKSITRGSGVYNDIEQQLYDYLHDPNYAASGDRGIGVVVSAALLGKTIDWNLGTELLQDLKNKYPNDPAIQKLNQIYVKPISYSLPDPSSNRWCRM